MRRKHTLMLTDDISSSERITCSSCENDMAKVGDLFANMCLAVHPTYVTSTTYSRTCDNYILTENGCERIHQFPEKITELQ